MKVYQDYVADTGDKTKTVIASTASPYKFSGSVLDALGQYDEKCDEFDLVDKLADCSKLPVPKSLAELKDKAIRFDGSVEKSEMENCVFSMLKI